MDIDSPIIRDNAQIIGPNDPSVTIAHSTMDELSDQPLDATPTDGIQNKSMYIVLICTCIVVLIFAYQLIRLLIRMRERAVADDYERCGKQSIETSLSMSGPLSDGAELKADGNADNV